MQSQNASDLQEFFLLWWKYLSLRSKTAFFRFERVKGKLAESLYRQRGKLARPFVHGGMGILAAFGITVVPIIAEELPRGPDPWQQPAPSSVLSAATENPLTETYASSYRGEIIEYTVQAQDTVSSIAEKFGISQETIIWQNSLKKNAVLKPGQKLEILPITGIAHKVRRGETIYSIAERYSVDAQNIVNYTFNTFVNDETFSLAVGQTLIVPDGVPPKEAPPPGSFARRRTPDAGTVTASGAFVWPTAGNLSQRYVWYHKGIDIANKGGPDVLAADSGAVLYAGCLSWGYGCHVIIDHGNGFQTLYAHMSRLYVGAGQRVARGNAVGRMGSTGRSTGTHLHFEIRQAGVLLDPLQFLK